MNASDIQRLSDWLEQNFGRRVTKEAVLQKAQTSDLPTEIIDAIADLPEGDHDCNSVVSLVQEKVMGQQEMAMGEGAEGVPGRTYTGP